MATAAWAQALRPYDTDIYAPDLIAVQLLYFLSSLRSFAANLNSYDLSIIKSDVQFLKVGKVSQGNNWVSLL